ncbi:MAG TPA: CoB--CoM heterodisulfide reductase iron-sulfur subunit B family protein [Candidatus Saccharimonadales bacterium]|nr:CoB--CoM heterodisulfide reductase iron-sulfur subunit B family protein [Candidatus Saccharimonadales bacterium]
MRYVYYPGCSLKGSGRPYEESLLAVFKKLGIAAPELKDWNCCGATSYMSVDETKAFALAARNLAIAEGQNGGVEVHFLAPCNACYLVHSKVQAYMKSYKKMGKVVTDALASTGMQYKGTVKVRHPLDVLVNDVGLEKIQQAATRPLKGLKVACYYGCQLVRPYATFDNPHDPMTMDQVLRACGAETVEWPLKARCCGGTLTGTIEEVGLRLSQILLHEAKRRGAEVVATACPLCQFNLECYQDRMKKRFGEDVSIPVVYFTQLMGRAMGITDSALGLQRNLVSLQPAAASA